MGTDILNRANWCIDFKEKKIIADSTVPEHYDFMLEYNVKDNLYYADLEIGNLSVKDILIGHCPKFCVNGNRIQL